MSRSTKIYSKVIRNLKTDGIDTSVIEKEAIFDEMQEGQHQIILLTNCIETEKKKTFVEDQDSYKFSKSDRDFVGMLKLPIKMPFGFDPVEYIPNVIFDDLVDTEYVGSGPYYATIFNNTVKFYPIPGADIADQEFSFSFYNKDSEEILTAIIDPETPDYFDRAIENYTTAQFSIKSKEWMDLFYAEIQKLGIKSHLKTNSTKVPECNW